MRQKQKYFVLNKQADYKRGYMDNISCLGQGITVSPGEKYGSFFSRVLDTGEYETVWHRLLFKTSETSAPVTVTVYAADNLIFQLGGKTTCVQDIIYSKSLKTEKKKDILKSFKAKTITGENDVLLYDVIGRYLWLIADIYTQDEKTAVLENFIIYFPKQTWINYLPEVYQPSGGKSSFLERYLSIFQTLYDDINQKIGSIPSYLDPYGTEGEYLGWLAGFIGIKDSYLWTETQLRYLIAHAAGMYGMRGTKQGIMDFVSLFTGDTAYIIEYQQIAAEKLYNQSPYVFTVMVKEEHVPSEKEYKMLTKIIEDVKPMHMEFDLVVMKPYIFLDSHSYLGINSVLGQYQILTLDGFSLLPFSAINNNF